MSEKDQPQADAGAARHPNDMYGAIDARSEAEAGVQPAIPAATVLLLRDGAEGVEVLMLRKSSKITFGGMWVFPGGRIDAEDHGQGGDLEVAARNAAVRETREEAGIELSVESFVHFSHWTPPPGPQKRFATWFFAAHVEDELSVQIDEGEIQDHAWINPAAALERHAAGEIDIVPPTWVSLYHLSRHAPAARFVEQVRGSGVKVYSTRVAKAADGHRVAMWYGDAGYADWDADLSGARHRLVMTPGGFRFENTVEHY